MADKSTFVKITNREIYDSLQGLHLKIDKINEKQAIHEKLLGFGGLVVSAIAALLFQHMRGGGG